MQAQLQLLCLASTLITLTYTKEGAPTTYKAKPSKYQVKQGKEENLFSFGCDCGYYKNDFMVQQSYVSSEVSIFLVTGERRVYGA